jgi:ADP-heptose:LPS heptosyltransferase
MIVVLRALGLGDLLTAVPALHALRAWAPAAEIVVGAPAPLAPLARLAGVTLSAVAPLAPLAPALRGADVLVNLHGRGPQSHRVALGASPRRLVAFAHAEVPESAGMPLWKPSEHEARRWCRLLTESGIPAVPSRLELAPPPDRGPLWAHGATVVHPGAASAARRWPPARFAAVARAERAAGRTVAITGGADERALALAVAERAGVPVSAVLAGRTDVETLAAIVARAARVVCGDTGMAHLATAFGTPSVVLFGPTPPREWGPPPADRHRVLWAGRTGDPHAGRPDPGLLAIGPGAVLAELENLEGPRP